MRGPNYQHAKKRPVCGGIGAPIALLVPVVVALTILIIAWVD